MGEVVEMNAKEGIISLRDVFKGNQLVVWEDFQLYTLQDLAKYLFEHPPSFIKSIKWIDEKIMAMTVLACHDHGIQLNTLWEKWYLAFTSKNKSGKIWIREVQQRKAAGVFSYGRGGMSKDKSLDKHRDQKRDQKLVEAEHFMIRYLKSGVPFDAVRTCDELDIEYESPDEAGRIARRNWNTVEEAGRMDEMRELAGCDLDTAFTEAIQTLRQCQAEKKKVYVELPPLRCPNCKKMITFNKKVAVEIDITRERVAAARELSRLGALQKRKTKAGLEDIPDSAEEAKQQIIELVVRSLKALNWHLPEFTKEVEERLVA